MPARPEHGPLFYAALRLAALAAVGPSSAMTALTLLYAWSDRHCERGSGPLWAGWAGALALSAASFGWLWRRRRVLERPPAAAPAPLQRERELFLVNAGLALNLISLLLLFAFASPLLRLRPCQ